MPKKLKVGVMMGGPSSESAISLLTGKAILENLDKKQYAVSKIEMDKNSVMWVFSDSKKKKLDLVNKDRKKFDLIFIAMHGAPGESGGVQGMLDTLGIKYTGPGALASALAMNKVYAAQVYFANGLNSPKFIHFKNDGWKERREAILSDIKKSVDYPAVIKPVDQGSAVGVGIVKNEADLIKFVNKNIKKFPWLMVQKFIKGKEGTCGVMEMEGKVFALPPTHILPNFNEFYDFKSKYSKGGSNHICPADFGKETNEAIQSLAIAAHRSIGCRGMSRSDIFVGDDGKLWLIETNTIPGMTGTSLFPEAAGKMGINFSEMLDLIIVASL